MLYGIVLHTIFRRAILIFDPAIEIPVGYVIDKILADDSPEIVIVATFALTETDKDPDPIVYAPAVDKSIRISP